LQFQDFNKEKQIKNAQFAVKDYKLTTNYSKFPSADSGVLKSLRGAMLGQDEFGVVAIKKSEYDLEAAVKKYRFCLLPRTVSEINPLDFVELMSRNLKEYEVWTDTLLKSIKFQSKIVGTSATDGTLSANDIETMIITANIANI
jgi:hypothetical protein